MSIGKKIKIAREKAKLSQEEVSDKLGITRQTLSNWENDKFLPDILNVIKMSSLYEISLDELLKEEKEIIKKLENDTKKLKNYKTSYKYAFLVMLLGSILILLNSCFNFPEKEKMLFNVAAGICVFISSLILSIVFAKNVKSEENIEKIMPDDDILVILGYFVRTKKIPKIIKYIIISIFFLVLVLYTLYYDFGIGKLARIVSSIFILILGGFLLKIIHDN